MHSAAFSELAQEFCGMFRVDHKRRRITTMSKSGCCWHQFNSYDVVDHAPHLLDSVVERLAPFSSAYLGIERLNRPVEYQLTSLEDSGATPVLSFELQGSPGRRVELFVMDGELDCAFVAGPSRKVELSYQLDVVGQRHDQPKDPEPPFHFDHEKRELSFRNGDYRYVVSDAPGRLGVTVQHAGESVFLAGVEASRCGALQESSNLASASNVR